MKQVIFLLLLLFVLGGCASTQQKSPPPTSFYLAPETASNVYRFVDRTDKGETNALKTVQGRLPDAAFEPDKITFLTNSITWFDNTRSLAKSEIRIKRFEVVVSQGRLMGASMFRYGLPIVPGAAGAVAIPLIDILYRAATSDSGFEVEVWLSFESNGKTTDGYGHHTLRGALDSMSIRNAILLAVLDRDRRSNEGK